VPGAGASGSATRKMEGGNVGSHGNPLHRIENWALGNAPHVSVAGRKDQFGQRGTMDRVIIGGRTYYNVPFRVDDTGSQSPKYFGPGTNHLDIAHSGDPNASASATGIHWGKDTSRQVHRAPDFVKGPAGHYPAGLEHYRMDPDWPGHEASPSTIQNIEKETAKQQRARLIADKINARIAPDTLKEGPSFGVDWQKDIDEAVKRANQIPPGQKEPEEIEFRAKRGLPPDDEPQSSSNRPVRHEDYIRK
jgi:hypothetical protein